MPSQTGAGRASGEPVGGEPLAAGPVVVGRDLIVKRGDNVVLNGLTFTIPGGRVTGLLGPSGCGKSTLMRTLVGVQVITAGSVTLLGLPAGHPVLRSQVGYATQDQAVYTDLTLRENLRYFGIVLGLRGAALTEAVTQVIAALDMTDLEKRVIGTFSGGELARAGLAVALLGKPRLLVLDEPTAGLDPVLRRDLWALFHRIAIGGAAVVVSSHVMGEAARCDHLLFMRDGLFLAQAPPAEILRRTGAVDMEDAFLRLASAPVAPRVSTAPAPAPAGGAE